MSSAAGNAGGNGDGPSRGPPQGGDDKKRGREEDEMEVDEEVKKRSKTTTSSGQRGGYNYRGMFRGRGRGRGTVYGRGGGSSPQSVGLRPLLSRPSYRGNRGFGNRAGHRSIALRNAEVETTEMGLVSRVQDRNNPGLRSVSTVGHVAGGSTAMGQTSRWGDLEGLYRVVDEYGALHQGNPPPSAIGIVATRGSERQRRLALRNNPEVEVLSSRYMTGPSTQNPTRPGMPAGWSENVVEFIGAEITCANCARKGHSLAICTGPPEIDGYMRGCPWYVHDETKPELFRVMVANRPRMPAFRSNQDWRFLVITQPAQVNYPFTAVHVRLLEPTGKFNDCNYSDQQEYLRRFDDCMDPSTANQQTIVEVLQREAGSRGEAFNLEQLHRIRKEKEAEEAVTAQRKQLEERLAKHQEALATQQEELAKTEEELSLLGKREQEKKQGGPTAPEQPELPPSGATTNKLQDLRDAAHIQLPDDDDDDDDLMGENTSETPSTRVYKKKQNYPIQRRVLPSIE